MAGETVHLRLRVIDPEPGRGRRVEVLDPDGKVLGHLADSTTGLSWKMGMAGELSVLRIEIATERAQIDSIEIPGLTVPRANAGKKFLRWETD